MTFPIFLRILLFSFRVLPGPGLFIFLPVVLAGQDLFVAGNNPFFAWGSYNKPQVDAFSFTGNKAALARVVVPGLGLVGERLYGLQEIHRYRVSAALPVKKAGFGLQAGYAVAGLYREGLLGLACGRKLGKAIDLGTQFTVQRATVPGYTSYTVLSADVGLLLHLTSRINAGWNIRIPYQVNMGDQHGGIPFYYSMGIGFDAAAGWCAAMELEKSPFADLRAGVGFIYEPHALVKLKLGVRSGGIPFWFGCSYQLKSFRVDFSVSIHDRLGITPGVGLHHSFPRK
ncbi:MAG: hypothetical protein ABWZ25_10375 [Chitinophagaceae bacterium]